MNRKKRILIYMGGFLPGKKMGGPPVSVDNFCTLMSECECYIVTKNHDMDETEPYPNLEQGWNRYKNYFVLYLPDNRFNKKEFERVLIEIQPDIIYLQGLFQSCTILALSVAKKNRIPVLLAPRGELCSGAFKKKYKKLPYIFVLKIFGLINNIHFQATSEEEGAAIKLYLGSKQSHIHYLTNVPTVGEQKNINYGVKLAEMKKQGEANLVFLSRIVRKKNLLYIIECLKDIQENVNLDIYGPKEDMNYWKECQKAINLLPHNVRVRYLGVAEHHDVHRIFSEYDAFVFLTKSENYGHVIVESIVVGTPVVVSNQTPWNDIQKYEAGWVVDIDNKAEFVAALNDIINMNADEMIQKRENNIQYSRLKLDYDQIKRQYSEVLDLLKIGK